MTSLKTTSSLAALAMLTLGTVAGCAATAPTGPATITSGSGDYTDGSYTETGEYTAPSGREAIEVTVTLADNVVTEVSAVGDATDPQAKLYQRKFSDGVADLVVGKNIDELSVDKVGGSSLTSDGFNDAIAAIKADAAK